MKTWQKALIWGGVLEPALLLVSAILLMSSIGPAGPEGFRAQLSEYLQFPGCQLMEKADIKSFPVTALFMIAINFAVFSSAAFLLLKIRSKK